MKAIHIKYKDENRIKVEFDYDPQKIKMLKQIKEAKWSNTLKAWHIPYTKQAFEQLKSLFPDIDYDNKKQIEENKKTIQRPLTENQSLSSTINKKDDVTIIVNGRRISIKLPKNDADTRFLLSLRYSRWDKKQYCWIIPNYPGNIELLKNYFKDRITKFEVHEQIEINGNKTSSREIGKNDLLIIKTKSGRLKFHFGYNKALTKVIKSMPYHSWNSTNKYWSIPFAEKYLQEIRVIAADQKLSIIYEIEETDSNIKSKISRHDIANYKNCPEEYILKIKELRYSDRTLKSYKASFEEFINYYNNTEPEQIDESMILNYLSYLVNERKVSTSYQNQSINAIKFYYERVLKMPRKVYYVDRPKKEKTLPNVLSSEEVQILFKTVDNLKHKTILMLAYSAGLRLNELINVKLKDIDSTRMQIRVEQGKGKKDRYTLLSVKFLELLRKYYTQYNPKFWLFEGANGVRYSARSIQMIMQDAVKKAGIKKKVSIHTLRHSFATHLLESGVDLRYIQSLLGHESSKTTEIYTHITTKGFDQIRSPLDGLNLS